MITWPSIWSPRPFLSFGTGQQLSLNVIFSFAENLAGVCCFVAACFHQPINYNMVFQVETKAPFLLKHADVVVEWSVMYIIYCRILTGSPGRQLRVYTSCFFTKRQLFYLLCWSLDVCVFDRLMQKTKTHERWNLQVRCVISAASQEHGHITASGWAFFFSVFQCTVFLWRSFALRHKMSQKHRHRSIGIRLESSRETASLLHPHLSSHSLHLINALTRKSSCVLPEIHQPLPYFLLPLLSFFFLFCFYLYNYWFLSSPHLWDLYLVSCFELWVYGSCFQLIKSRHACLLPAPESWQHYTVCVVFSSLW